MNKSLCRSKREGVLTLTVALFFFKAVASGEGWAGGVGARGAAAPLDLLSQTRHIKSVDGVVFFRLSYFDYSDLQLFSIFRFEVEFSETCLMTSA